MKKIFIAILTVAVMSPVFVHAQSVDTATMSNDQLRVYLISLIQEVIQLENQLITMQNNQPSAPVAQNVQTPSQATVVAQEPIVVPPAQPVATTTQAPIVAGTPAPQPSGYSIQIIAW